MNPDSQCKGGLLGIQGTPDEATTFPCPICKATCEVIRPRATGGRKPLPKLESTSLAGTSEGVRSLLDGGARQDKPPSFRPVAVPPTIS